MINRFFKNAKLLNSTFKIVPLLYGSLGLEYLTKTKFDADDVDILIPKCFLEERWLEFKQLLEQNGYVLINEREHEFKKDNATYAYAQIEELALFANIDIAQINTVFEDNAQFKLLNLQQYLNVYNASIKDGYRINVRQKRDAEKIELIKNLLTK